jgi:thioesterase domain-containing protein
MRRMNAADVETYLHDHIPLSRAMQVAVREASETALVLAAPLAPNINHRDTLFGGSASAIAILAAWSLLHVRLRRAGLESRLVIQRNTMHYDLPISGDFVARAVLPEAAVWDAFVRMLTRKGRGRITIESALEFEGRVCGRLEGEFVALALHS